MKASELINALSYISQRRGIDLSDMHIVFSRHRDNTIYVQDSPNEGTISIAKIEASPMLPARIDITDTVTIDQVPDLLTQKLTRFQKVE